MNQTIIKFHEINFDLLFGHQQDNDLLAFHINILKNKVKIIFIFR